MTSSTMTIIALALGALAALLFCVLLSLSGIASSLREIATSIRDITEAPK